MFENLIDLYFVRYSFFLNDLSMYLCPIVLILLILKRIYVLRFELKI